MCYSGDCPYELTSGEGIGGCSLPPGDPTPLDARCRRDVLEDWLKDFTVGEVLADQKTWLAVVEHKRLHLRRDVQMWLDEWESFDSKCSPDSDLDRSFVRYGHRLGWIARDLLENVIDSEKEGGLDD